MSDIHETPDIGIAASHGGKAPPRDRALTEEGKAYNIETLSKRYTYLTTKIKRQCNHLLELLETNNSDMISAQSSLLDLQYAEAEELNKRLIDLLDNEMVNQRLTGHEVTDTLVFDIKDKVCKWTKQKVQAKRVALIEAGVQQAQDPTKLPLRQALLNPEHQSLISKLKHSFFKMCRTRNSES